MRASKNTGELMKVLVTSAGTKEGKELSRERTLGQCYKQINFAEDEHANDLLNFFYTFIETIFLI